jgi:hypothetical protein
MSELRRRLRTACLTGSIFFGGNDRSPDASATDVGKTAAGVLGGVLPTVYDRFPEASAKPADLRKGVDALFVAENLNGLPAIFNQLSLLRDEQGRPVFKTDVTPLSEVIAQIDAKANYGEQATGKFLEDEFDKAPFGWDFEAVRLLTLSLLRAGRIEAISKGVTIDSATSPNAKECFSNNNLFRSTNFRPKKSVDFQVVVEAAENFKNTFGNEAKELAAGSIATEIRREIDRHSDDLDRVLGILRTYRLPGAEIIENATDQMKAIRRGTEENAIITFNAGHRTIKDAIRRAADISNLLTEPALNNIERARQVIATKMPELQGEGDLDPSIVKRAEELRDVLGRETFYREVAAIEQAATVIQAEYKRRYDAALGNRVKTYVTALETLTKTSGWERLDEAQQGEVARPLRQCADPAWNKQTIRHLRSETEACEKRLSAATEKVHQMLEGDRLATVSVAKFFEGGIENDEQLEQALTGIRDECSRLLGAGKKVIVR